MDSSQGQTPIQPGVTDTPEFQNFEDLARKIFAVPKSEVDKLEAEWRERQKDKKQKKLDK